MLDNDSIHTVTQMREKDAIWILKDDDGCVMLTTDEEDGVPVWSSQEQAVAWTSDDWSHCEPLSINVETWLKKWTVGLMQDQLVIMLNPSEFQEEGVVTSPEAFAEALTK
ncbi:DUF2750 domain-containing protein [Alteromonas sediminis]|uniref:DUF2750 domain-containing protein n=1 Tax=Alteromonas sediminis TaxID=2259342 RepID=A0A3N5ZBN4_9ALTE|nr:DUF2750 domain-containing protein [Alteromonas sediminis]RPJ67068.1 DUF2750 domain-containing protein [Alteromonas sediminis]